MYFDRQTLSPTTTVDDVNGHPLQALTVFALSLGYLRSQLLDAVQGLIKDQKGVDMSQIDFLYVITVPAIWDDAARQFMREAASLVGVFFYLSMLNGVSFRCFRKSNGSIDYKK